MDKPAAIVKNNLSLLWFLETSTEITPVRVDEGAWQFPLAQHKPCIYFLAFACLYPASLQSRWGRAHVTACVCDLEQQMGASDKLLPV